MKKPLIIVSGFPRSGTSMMMSMLKVGGIKIATDKAQEPDEDNPNGYYEDKRTKYLDEDNSWIAELSDCALKVVSINLCHLPCSKQYEVIYMTRDKDEVIRSYQKLTQHRYKRAKYGYESAEELTKVIKDSHQRSRDWIKKTQNVKCLDLNYHEVLADPLGTAERVSSFLSTKELDTHRMSQVVDKRLYRNRA